MADVMAMLSQMRNASGDMDTIGLPDHVILEFASLDDKLVQAVQEAAEKQSQYPSEHLMMSERRPGNNTPGRLCQLLRSCNS
ncbi:MAG: hypothetical protein ACJZ6A_01560 [Candidatus Poseidoniaceae archaeon]